MNANISLSDILHESWTMHDEVAEIAAEEIHPVVIETEDTRSKIEYVVEGKQYESDANEEADQKDLKETPKPSVNSQKSSNTILTTTPNSSNVLISPPYFGVSIKQEPSSPPVLYYPGYAHGYSVSSTYHQPFVSMVRQKKTSALATALQRPKQTHPVPTVPAAYIPSCSFGFGTQYSPQAEQKTNKISNDGQLQKLVDGLSTKESDCEPSVSANAEREGKSDVVLPYNKFGDASHATYSSCIPNRPNTCFGLETVALDEHVEKNANGINHIQMKNERENHETDEASNKGDTDSMESDIRRYETEEKLVDNREVEEEGVDKEIVAVDEGDIGIAPTPTVSDKADVESATSHRSTGNHKSQLQKLLMQPVKRSIHQEYQPPFVVAFSAIGNQPLSSGQLPQLPKTMQFYQPPTQQHHARSTPPPGFAQFQPYGMGMRPHEEETRQIMNLDSQQTHNSSPTQSWNQPYGQMTNLNAYQRGPNTYVPPVPPMVHQNGPPGVVPTSNPYYPTTGPPPHHHIQPQAPMMAPGMHGQQQQQQQPYYNTQSPLTGTPPSMSYGNPQIPAPQPPTTNNGSAPIFNFSKPRNSNEGSSVNGGGHRRKKHNDLSFQSSPRYNNNSNEDIDGSVFPDMGDFPLLDVVQSKAKKDAGRKPCRPHLCEQSRMLISRVCHFQREFVKRLPARHPLANSPFSKPDQWTSQIMGISLATVRKCVDMAVDEEVFTRCTDKNLVNLTPSERAEREELLSKLSNVFEGEKTLGAGTAGMTIAEYSPRRSYSNTLLRQSTDDKSSNSSFANGADYGSSETTLLNLDDHSNHSKDFGVIPTPTTDLSNGGHIFEELGSIGGGSMDTEEKLIPVMDTPKRGRPRKAPGTTTSKPSKRKESNEDSEVSEDRDEHEKKTEDEDETNEETEKKTEEIQQIVLAAEREDDAASSEGTNRSETATPEPAADTSVAKKTRAAARRKNTKTVDEEFQASTKKKRGSVTSATAGVSQFDDENSDHKMVTRARSRQP